jgi:Nucleotidyl transferase AbiEii toxin, Type IV TA system
VKEVGKSVKNRLNNIAKQTNRQHSDLLQYYAMERFLYRLSVSTHRDKFLLKGALLLQSVDNNLARATKDIDFIATFLAREDRLKSMLIDCVNTPVQDDGVGFDAKSITISEIQRDTRYCGFRVLIKGKIDTAQIGVQLDIGFGTSIIPGPMEISYPSLLDFEAPKILGSSLECAIADKFEAMVSRGDANTRLKDFYDIWIITKNRSFVFEDVCRAIAETFHYYETEIPISLPICLSTDFYRDPSTENRWRTFLKRSRLNEGLELSTVIEQIFNFTIPVCDFVNNRGKQYQTWSHAKHWHSQLSKDV